MSFSRSSRIFNKLSKIFQPITVVPKDVLTKNQELMSNSQRLMLELGVIRQASSGSFHLLPLGVRSLEKLVKLVDNEMHKIGAQKVIFPALTNASLWKATGRFDEQAAELFKLKDRKYHTLILSPTYEETASELLASVAPLSYKRFPIRLYQTTSKYRDEMKPRFGLIRSKQFIMKDLYTFDMDTDSAKTTYEEVCATYNNIFKKIGVDFVKVLGTTGNIGGSISHEYHYLAEVGEDEIISCTNCGFTANTQLHGNKKCPQCEATEGLKINTGIEVGHTFLLGDKYSKPLNATYLSPDATPIVLQMGSYGIGMSRILAASVEVLSLEQEMRWPDALAPYSVIIIPSKSGSKEEATTQHLTEKLYLALESLPELNNDIIIDDRTTLTIGRRYLEARRMGYPFIVVIGKKAAEEAVLFEVNDVKRNSQMYLNEVAVVNYIKQNIVS